MILQLICTSFIKRKELCLLLCLAQAIEFLANLLNFYASHIRVFQTPISIEFLCFSNTMLSTSIPFLFLCFSPFLYFKQALIHNLKQQTSCDGMESDFKNRWHHDRCINRLYKLEQRTYVVTA